MKQPDEKVDVNNPEAAMDVMRPQWGSPLLRGVTGFAIGGAMMQTGLDLLDVHLDWFSGIATFNASWILAMTLLPVTTGIVIGMVYGYGGKYLAHFPPAAVLLISYYQSLHTQLPEGTHLLPIGLWVVFIILQMEFCAVGGFLGEIFVRRRTGWFHRYGPAPDAVPLPDDQADSQQSAAASDRTSV
ncbi:hypothetical protein FE236_01970 [Mariprofundus erugo]|uniref:Uncharacterized protein n=1 Tax=Mariprofundus erugo TaxID=2528639 RepID=A0A5R9GQ92_9PROT|nr:hypothetical protein [Mariprofundus erugo]TLS66457.1 hypothetical protein FEF65_09805 [Mariprofundus erugo]TLS77897.1 hypothetical protein FE236_01970 [Mariprofundus erugo]